MRCAAARPSRPDLSPWRPRPGIDGWPKTALTLRGSMTGDGGHEFGHLARFAALVELGGHLPQAARAPFCDRVFDQGAPPRRRRDLLADAHVEVGTGASHRLGCVQGVTDRAGAGEELAPA